MDEVRHDLPLDASGAEVRAGQRVRYQGQGSFVVRNVFVGCDGGRSVISPAGNLDVVIRAHTRELEVSPTEAALAAAAGDASGTLRFETELAAEPTDEQAAIERVQDRLKAIHREPT